MVDDEILDAMRVESDEPADAVVIDHFERCGGRASELFGAMVDTTDQSGLGQDGLVPAYLRDRPPWPDWADPALVRTGQQFFEQWGPQILPALMLASLPETYAVARGVPVLQLTARLVTDPRRRLIETTQLTLDVMAVGGLDLDAPGYRSIRRVRLMHAAIRYLIAHDPRISHTSDPSVELRWSPEWGTPINQEDLLTTLLAFTVVSLDAIGRMGVTVRRSDAEAYLHAWSVAGHLLGIRPDLLPLQIEEAAATLAAVRRRQFASCPAGHELAGALESFASAQMHPRLLAGLPRSIIRYLIGDDTADLLGLAPADWTRVFFGPLRRGLHVLSLDEQHASLMRTVARKVNESLVTGFVDHGRGAQRPSFAIPTHLADRWSLPPSARGTSRPPVVPGAVVGQL